MFNEKNEEEKLKYELNEFAKDVKAERGIFYRAIERYESYINKRRAFISIFRVLVPVSLSILIVFSAIFPVFGNNGTLVDIVNSYRINKNINELKNTYLSSSLNETRFPINSATLQTVFEKEYGLNPQDVYRLRIKNQDDTEIITIVIVSKLTNAKPEELINMRHNNYSWGIIARKKGVDPRLAINQLQQFRRKLEMQEKPLLIRGEVEAYTPETGSITINTFPLKIYLSENTKLETTIEKGTNLEIEAKYIISSNLVEALRVRELNPTTIGIQPIIGKVVSINENSISLLLKDGSVKEVKFTPRTILHPPHIPLIPGNIVRIDTINDEGYIIALKIIQKAPSPLPPRFVNPSQRRWLQICNEFRR